MQSEINHRTINSIQGLRAYAALSVMVGHGLLEALANYNLPKNFNEFPLLAGVDIFFVISGFIMYHTSGSMFEQPGATFRFWWRRFIRVVPLYWFFTTLMVLTLLFLGGLVRATEFDTWNVISSYLFFPAERPGGRIAPVLSLGWTLNYEIFFYFIFGISLLFNKGVGVPLLLIILVLLSIFGSTVEQTVPALKFWTNSIILEFGFGVIIAMSFRNLKRAENSVLAILLFVLAAALLLILSNLPLPRFIVGGVPATILVAAAIVVPTSVDEKLPGWIVVLGGASYALYLCHRFVLRAVTIIWERLALDPTVGVTSYVIVATALSIIASIAVFRWIEAPFLGLFKNKARQQLGSVNA